MPPKKTESGAAKKSTSAGHSYQVCYNLFPNHNTFI